MIDSDEDDFILSPSSKLASIFNTSNSEENSSLTYKAPKQPQPIDTTKALNAEATPESLRPKIGTAVWAKAIMLSKSDNGKITSMGKHMVAILRNLLNGICVVIIYREKAKIIFRQILEKSLNVYKYPHHNFVAFCVKEKQFWNLKFDTSDDREIFLQHVSNCNCVIIEKKDDSSNNSYSGPGLEKSDTISNETQHKEGSSKEQILSRITKMGQSILPRPLDRTEGSDMSDSETESSISDPSPSKPVTAPKKFKRNVNHHEKALAPIVPETRTTFTPHLASNNHFLMPNNQMGLSPHTAGVMYSQPMPDYGLSNFIIAQNSELKANLAEINTKLNNVLSSPDNNSHTREDISHLQSKIKCQNLKIDNLSSDLERSRKALENLTKKYVEKCDEYVKQQIKIEHTECTAAELNANVQSIDVLKRETEQAKVELEERNKQIEIQNIKLKEFEDYFKSIKTFKENITRENNDLKQKLEETSLKVSFYEEELKQKENNVSLIQDQSLILNKESINKIVKEAMSEAFTSIMESFDEHSTYRSNHIRGVLLGKLKKTSYTLISSLGQLQE